MPRILRNLLQFPMTPKEKAFEIIESYFRIVARYDFDTNDKYDEPYQEIAEKCALIAVKDIYYNCGIFKKIYWLNVEQEIKNICNSK